MHNVPYVRHPRCQKTIATVKIQYYWLGMKKEVVEFIAKCLECQKVNDPDLCRNTMKYRNTHKRRDAAEIRLHFINNK
jgi:hypothetical protein